MPTSVINEAWIGRSRPFIMQATIPINACCRPSPPEAAAITARDDADARTRIRPKPLPITASLARCLARLPSRRTPPSCQLPAIPHVGKVGVGVPRPQRTTVMPTSHATATTATA
ncbi:hypothetical protein ACLOJK_026898 [Asimina triloba]